VNKKSVHKAFASAICLAKREELPSLFFIMSMIKFQRGHDCLLRAINNKRPLVRYCPELEASYQELLLQRARARARKDHQFCKAKALGKIIHEFFLASSDSIRSQLSQIAERICNATTDEEVMVLCNKFLKAS